MGCPQKSPSLLVGEGFRVGGATSIAQGDLALLTDGNAGYMLLEIVTENTLDIG